MPRILLTLALAMLAGCTLPPPPPPPPPIELTAFNPDEVAFIRERGNITINGSAFLRQRGGGVVTCAGSIVSLIPAGKHARERMEILYDSDAFSVRGLSMSEELAQIAKSNTKSRTHLADDPPRGFPEESLEYLQYRRETRCDAEGKFKFPNVSAGTYFITTSVEWTVGYKPQGGTLMLHVSLFGIDEEIDVVLNL